MCSFKDSFEISSVAFLLPSVQESWNAFSRVALVLLCSGAAQELAGTLLPAPCHPHQYECYLARRIIFGVSEVFGMALACSSVWQCQAGRSGRRRWVMRLGAPPDPCRVCPRPAFPLLQDLLDPILPFLFLEIKLNK